MAVIMDDQVTCGFTDIHFRSLSRWREGGGTVEKGAGTLPDLPHS